MADDMEMLVLQLLTKAYANPPPLNEIRDLIARLPAAAHALRNANVTRANRQSDHIEQSTATNGFSHIRIESPRGNPRQNASRLSFNFVPPRTNAQAQSENERLDAELQSSRARRNNQSKEITKLVGLKKTAEEEVRRLRVEVDKLNGQIKQLKAVNQHASTNNGRPLNPLTFDRADPKPATSEKLSFGTTDTQQSVNHGGRSPDQNPCLLGHATSLVKPSVHEEAFAEPATTVGDQAVESIQAPPPIVNLRSRLNDPIQPQVPRFRPGLLALPPVARTKRSAADDLNQGPVKEIKIEDVEGNSHTARLSKPVCLNCHDLKLDCNSQANCQNCSAHLRTCTYVPCFLDTGCKDHTCHDIHTGQWKVFDQRAWHIKGITTVPEGAQRGRIMNSWGVRETLKS